MATQHERVHIPTSYPCSTFFVDESTSKASGGSFFVVGAVKLRKPGKLLRSIAAIRDRYTEHKDELKFSTITRGRLPMYNAIIDALEESDARLLATVVDRTAASSPFSSSEAEWITHARVTAKLLVGSLNARELGVAVIDQRSTPVESAFDETVRSMANQRLKSIGFVSVVCADSRSSHGLQLADLVAGAVAHQRVSKDPNSGNHKATVARRLASAFGVSSFVTDQRTNRVNVLTLTS
ncbi:hypothetical protein NJ76_20160 [Rhodococcus sp. IITR03]|nr:hypothetical protein NJ76_20160 [Rhodococcus sp. IITR03]